MILVNGTIYLATYDNGPVRYPGIEVSEMSKVKKLSTPCNAIPDPKTEEAIQLFKQLDEDRAASEKIVTIRFHNAVTQAVLAIFGENTLLVPDGESHFITNIVGIDCDQFYARISFFGTHAQIIGPDEFLDGYEKYLNDIFDVYNYGEDPDYLQLTEQLQDSFHAMMRDEV